MNPVQFPRLRGFTLIELIITIAVMAILISVAIPSFTDFMDRYRLQNAARELHADLQFARSESVKRNRRVRLVFTTGSTWSYTMAWLDTAGTATTLKTVSQAQFTGTQIAGTNFNSSSTARTIVFNPQRGSVEDAANPPVPITTGRVAFRSARGKQACVHVNLLGRPNICSPSGTNGGFPTCTVEQPCP